MSHTIKQPLNNMFSGRSAGLYLLLPTENHGTVSMLSCCLATKRLFLQAALLVVAGLFSLFDLLPALDMDDSVGQLSHAKPAGHTCKLHNVGHGCCHAQVRSHLASLLLVEQELEPGKRLPPFRPQTP